MSFLRILRTVPARNWAARVGAGAQGRAPRLVPATTPKILQVGVGRFGLEHLAVWTQLAAAREAELAGVVVTREESRAAIRQRFDVQVYLEIDDDLVRRVDGVDIVTPPDSHARLVHRCLPLAHVLVEKPLAMDAGEARELGKLAKKLGRILMVGHLFRFHPVVLGLKRLVSEVSVRPRGIRGTMTNPRDDSAGRVDANLELLHLFDILDFLFEVEPEVTVGRQRGPVNEISLRYPGPISALLRIGWEGEEKVRDITLTYSDRQIRADIIDNTIAVSTGHRQVEKSVFSPKPQALLGELRTFVAAIRGTATEHPDAAIGERIVRIAIASRPGRTKDRPRAAVIGGGIFGATCAIELADIAEVSLFERHDELLREVSFSNQGRHHLGFHYPRSYETVVEIKAAREAFETEYEAAINRAVPTYFCTSASGVEIPAERYLAACQSTNLVFSIEAPPEEVLDRSRVSLCLKTDEAVYDLPRLRQLVTDRLRAMPGVRLHLRTDVVTGAITTSGSKRLTVAGPGGTREESFDYLINATYANRNLVAQWFGFPVEPLRFDLYELLVLRLPIAPICVTILDGPFTALVSTGQDGWFLLSHIHDSVSRSVVPLDGMPPKWGEFATNRWNMLRHSARYLPVLGMATDVQSRWATRVVHPLEDDPDARPSVVTYHGFGCWSLLGGKIITCVTNAREIAAEILGEQLGTGARRRRGRGADSWNHG